MRYKTIEVHFIDDVDGERTRLKMGNKYKISKSKLLKMMVDMHNKLYHPYEYGIRLDGDVIKYIKSLSSPVSSDKRYTISFSIISNSRWSVGSTRYPPNIDISSLYYSWKHETKRVKNRIAMKREAKFIFLFISRQIEAELHNERWQRNNVSSQNTDPFDILSNVTPTSVPSTSNGILGDVIDANQITEQMRTDFSNMF